MSALLMYFVVKLTTFVAAACVTLSISALLLLILICYEIDTDDRNTVLTDVAKWLLVTFLTSLATVIFIPTTKQMAAIVVVPKIVSSDRVQGAGEKLYDLAAEWMDELHPRKREAGR